jgi:hypothetical protein
MSLSTLSGREDGTLEKVHYTQIKQHFGTAIAILGGVFTIRIGGSQLVLHVKDDDASKLEYVKLCCAAYSLSIGGVAEKKATLKCISAILRETKLAENALACAVLEAARKTAQKELEYVMKMDAAGRERDEDTQPDELDEPEQAAQAPLAASLEEPPSKKRKLGVATPTVASFVGAAGAAVGRLF